MVDEETPLTPEERIARVRPRGIPDDLSPGVPNTPVLPIVVTPPVVVITPPSPPPVVVAPPSDGGGGNNDSPSYPPPEPVVLDWWQKLAIETRAQLEAQLASIKSALDIANSVLQETLGRLAGLESKPVGKGDKGDKGEPGTNGTNGSNGTNGTNGRDGANGALFISTPEFTKIDQRIDAADGKALIAQSSADAQAARNNTQDGQIRSLQQSIAGLSGGGGSSGGGATLQQVALAVQDYFRSNPVSNGVDGKDGTNGRDGTNADLSNIPSINTVKAWVDEEITRLDLPALIRSLIPATPAPGGGSQAPGITIDQVKSAIATALEPLQGIMTDSEAFIWGMILGANDEFWTLFLDRLGTVELFKDNPEIDDIYKQLGGE